jgi:hypothetical protein
MNLVNTRYQNFFPSLSTYRKYFFLNQIKKNIKPAATLVTTSLTVT